QATVRMTGAYIVALMIERVPRVRVRGFRFDEKGARASPDSSFVQAAGACPGLVLEDLAIHSDGPGHGIAFFSVDIPPGQAHAVTRRCKFQAGPKSDGIALAGFPPGHARAGWCRGVVVRENRVLRSMRGINLQGRLRDIHVTGNLTCNPRLAGIEIRDLS